MCIFRPFRPCALGLILGTWATASVGATTAGFDVQITLSTQLSSGICISQSLSDTTGAMVKVICDTGQFVSIEPAPAKPFLGTMGSVGHVLFTPPTTSSKLLMLPSWAFESSTGTSAKLVEVVYETRTSGVRIPAPLKATSQTRSIDAYQRLYGAGADDNAEVKQDLTGTQQNVPVEMVVAF